MGCCIKSFLYIRKCGEIQLKHMHISTIVRKLQHHTVEKLHMIKPECFKHLSTCCHFDCEEKLKVDEDSEYCKIGKRQAFMVLEQVHSAHHTELKQKMLPSQGPELWHQWAMYDKEKNC